MHRGGASGLDCALPVHPRCAQAFQWQAFGYRRWQWLLGRYAAFCVCYVLGIHLLVSGGDVSIAELVPMPEGGVSSLLLPAGVSLNTDWLLETTLAHIVTSATAGGTLFALTQLLNALYMIDEIVLLVRNSSYYATNFRVRAADLALMALTATLAPLLSSGSALFTPLAALGAALTLFKGARVVRGSESFAFLVTMVGEIVSGA